MLHALGAAMLVVAAALPAAARAASPVPEAEEAFTAKLTPPRPQWGFVQGTFPFPGTRIFDGTSGRMLGTLNTDWLADIAIDPAGRYYYIAETLWSKGNRGTRQDLVSVYDSETLKLVTEISMPGRLLVGGRKRNFVLSTDGKLAFVYNMDPASSVNVVDLVRRKFVRTVELPGCASMMPTPAGGFAALCSDGSMATVSLAGSKPVITRSKPFFSASGDPIFDNFAYDKVRSEAVFVSYTGLVYRASLAGTPSIEAPWSLQQAAGMRPASTAPLEVSWYPGGFQPMALHRASGHLFVLMHMGEFWSHKAAGTEIWEVDLAGRKVVGRHALDASANAIEVTQGPDPLIFLDDNGGTVRVLDGKTFEEKHKIENGGGGVIAVADPR